ncbi:DNA polymerase I [Mycobacterium phage BPBiebs31]|uniref:DNA polymerase I n=1 Tax=Mycobacterium phage BPBiebs31 TaxID=2902900 RepID=G1D9Z8_9CAUD|nr:DNA polymerase [Mycobacterium phage BPBiebs31]AEJ91989.1 DNA polymerase I [Mycobacterium phage BPBiebs31]
MKQHRYQIKDETVLVNVVEHEDDLDGFESFIRSNLRILGLDTETTDLGIYKPDFGIRLIQFGNPWESWVLPVERGGAFVGAAVTALQKVQRFVIHNAAFDLQVIERTLGVPMEQMWPKVEDTKIYSHLVDPRAYKEGGTGHKLEELTKFYIDPVTAEEVKASMARLAKKHKTTKDKIWALVDLDDPDYELYAGMDTILVSRLLGKVAPLVPESSHKLIPYEHKLAEVMSYVERTGFLLDVDYSEKLSADMLRKSEHYTAVARYAYGVDSVNSTEKLADGLERTGVKIKGRTATGKRQVNAELLEALAEEGNALAKAAIEAKKWGSWEKTWVRNFIERRDANDRVHPGINPLQARTGRMSTSNPSAQNLPSGDWMVRRCFLADPGQIIASVDYRAQELRVLAALSGDQTMLRAFEEESDLHQVTADAAGVDRKIGKMANFLVCYGGGAGKLATNAGITFPEAKKVLEVFATTYPGVDTLNKRMQQEAGSAGFITTPTGRRLPVDPDRAYSALNYLIQSSSRDVTGAAVLRLHEAGFTPNMRLVVHDEVLLSLPEADAEAAVKEVGQIMEQRIGPVLVNTDPEVTGKSWGSGYMDEETMARHDAELRSRGF